MFLNHTATFTRFQPAAPATGCALMPATLVETPDGWRTAASLRRGDAVATLDGGFAPVTALSHDRSSAPTWHLPAGALDNCTDILLPGDQYIALSHPACAALSESPFLLAPVSALTGFRGITRTIAMHTTDVIRLSFADEEVVYANTGTLIHAAASTGTGFFPRLGYGETRAALNLINGGLCGPDRAAA